MSSSKTTAPRRWTAQEDQLLSEQVRSYSGAVNWVAVAQQHQGRSNKDCRNRWMKIKCQWSRGAWTEEEDHRLASAVAVYGHSWTSVSEAVGTRSPDQCAKHWTNALDPEISHGGWTDQEDQFLMEAVNNHGRAWKKISAQYFPNRSALELSNRYNVNLRRLQQADASYLTDTASEFYSSFIEDAAKTMAHTGSTGGDIVSGSWQDYDTLVYYDDVDQGNYAMPYLNGAAAAADVEEFSISSSSSCQGTFGWNEDLSATYFRSGYYDYGGGGGGMAVPIEMSGRAVSGTRR